MKNEIVNSGVLDNIVDFNKDEVKILLFSDVQIIDAGQQRYVGRLHEYSEKFWATDKVEKRAFRFIDEAVKTAKPDLILLSGDNVYGEFDDNGSMLIKFIEYMDSFKLPWAPVFGNHDNETKMGVEWTCKQYENSKYCLFKRGDITKLEGNGNYNVGIFNGDKLLEVIWLFDSHVQTNADVSLAQNLYPYGGILPGQIKYYADGMEELKKITGSYPENFCLTHIQFKAFGAGALKYGYVSEKNEFKCDDKKFERIDIPENVNGDFGVIGLDPCNYMDKEFVAHNETKRRNCKAWFFGHEHEICASVCYDGIRYTFGLKSSQYDSYIVGMLGSTLITVDGKDLAVKHLYSKFADDVTL